MKTFQIKTLGCKVNQYESQGIREKLLREGFVEKKNGASANLCVINTCTVTENADRKSLRMIRASVKKNPKAKIIVTGCLAAKDKDRIIKIKGVDCLIQKDAFSQLKISDFNGHNRAFLKIQDGCNNFCSFCKVPLVRGRSVSRPMKDIVWEVGQLLRKGFKEIVLTGICLGAYGIDLQKRTLLVDLLKNLESIEGIFRIRLSSIEPNFIDDRLISKLKDSKKICPHLHIPLQSGSDRILKKMKRQYKQEEFIKLIEKIRDNLPYFSLTTDLLVGFPGEEKNDFRETVDVVREIRPARCHIFPFSKREGTPAYNFKEQICDGEIAERIDALKDIAGILSFEYRKKFLGKALDVLVENTLDKKTNLLKGYSQNYILVFIENKDEDLKNKIVSVRMTQVTPNYSRGVPSLPACPVP